MGPERAVSNPGFIPAIQGVRGFLRVKKWNGAQGRNRTTDTGIFSPLLYRLSYLGDRKRVLNQFSGHLVKFLSCFR